MLRLGKFDKAGNLLGRLLVCSLVLALVGPDKPSSSLVPIFHLPGTKSAKPAPVSLPAVELVQTRFVQVAPRFNPEGAWQRTPGRSTAVVLLHGFHVFPFRRDYAARATFHSWQKPGSKLVEALAPYADVFAFAYSQNVPVDEIAGVPDLAAGVHWLKAFGYTQIVLIGHSAGGLIARQFVEDYPDAGVTKVIEVCAPNAGTNYAQLGPGVQKTQKPFVRSLTKDARARALKDRAAKHIPAGLPFVCVVGDGVGLGDGVVANESQWPPDLRGQGVPAVVLRTTHFTVVRSQAEVQRLTDLVRAAIPRWTPAQVALVKKELHLK